MVTTVNDVAATFLGDYDIDIAAVTAQEWVSLIRKAIAKIDLRHVRGFKPIHTLCTYTGEYGLKRTVSHDVMRNAKMYSSDLSHIVAPPHDWKDFPAQTETGTSASNPTIRQISIIVDREGILRLLNVDWEGREEDPDGDAMWNRIAPHRFAVATSLGIGELCDQELTELVTRHPRIVSEIFGSFWRMLSTSNGELQSMLNHATRMESLVERIHMATWRLGQQK